MNPFMYNGAVTGDNFYDREEETKQILLRLSSNIVLYAPRRYGKTSLVFHVIDELEKQGYTCIYLDFYHVYNLNDFATLYSKALARKQKPLERFAKQLKNGVKSLRPVISFNKDTGEQELSIDFRCSYVDVNTIDDLLELTQNLTSKDSRVFVFFDEFQEVSRLADGHFEAILRSIIQLQQTVKYLFFGSKRHLLQEAFMSPKRPFYLQAAAISLGKLPVSASVDYLTKTFLKDGINIDEKCCKYLIDRSANIPGYIQMLAGQVWQYMITDGKVVTQEIIDKGVRQLINAQSDLFSEIYGHEPERAKNILRFLAKGDNHLELNDHNQDMLWQLRDDEILENERSTYYIGDPFLRLFIKEYYCGIGIK
jgi:AAA+ ATPase superfamily predicted ATPase